MAEDSRKLSITYSSGLIPPPELMSTLAVFYDEIWLPYPYDVAPGATEFADLNPINRSQMEAWHVILNAHRMNFVEQHKTWNLLFKRKILKTISPVNNIEQSSLLLETDERLRRNYRSITGKLDDNDGLIAFALAIHTLFVHKPTPELFISNPSDTSTSRLAGFLVDAIFQLKIPQLKTLNAEQILEVRYKLRNFKEGFTDYVIRLTNDVEALLQSGETSEVIAARKVAERHFETEYNQICRQIEPIKIMSAGSVLAAGGAFFLAAAVQTTPAMLAALAVLYGTVLKDFWQQEAANKAADKQAFKYIAKLESEVSKRDP